MTLRSEKRSKFQFCVIEGASNINFGMIDTYNIYKHAKNIFLKETKFKMGSDLNNDFIAVSGRPNRYQKYWCQNVGDNFCSNIAYVLCWRHYLGIAKVKKVLNCGFCIMEKSRNITFGMVVNYKI